MNDDLRVSTYELIYPLVKNKELALATNGLYGAYDIVTAEEAATLCAAQKDSAALAQLPAATRERLTKRGHLLNASRERERENVSILSRLYWLLQYQSVLSLVIMPSYNCNFRCEYCYERQRLDRGSEWLGRVMEPDVLDAVFRQIQTYKDKGIKTDHCTIYGGEPLLKSNRKILEEICTRCEEMEISLSCITNGYELDEFLDMICAHNFTHIQITVDGVGEVHDKRRYLAGGQGSYARIMDNIALALERDAKISVRVNVNRANLDSAMELPEEFRKRGFLDKPHFRYYFKATSEYFEDDPANAITDAELFETLYRCGVCTDTEISPSGVYANIADGVAKALTMEHYPNLSPAYCGAEASMLVVDPAGTLYPCWDMVSIEEQAVGFTDVERGRFLFNFALPKWRGRTVDRMPDCVECPHLMSCGGGCAAESQNTYGDRMRGFCDSHKEGFALVAPRVCELEYEKNGENSLSRSLYDLFAAITEEERGTLLRTTSQKEAFDILKARLPEGVCAFG